MKGYCPCGALSEDVEDLHWDGLSVRHCFECEATTGWVPPELLDEKWKEATYKLHVGQRLLLDGPDELG